MLQLALSQSEIRHVSVPVNTVLPLSVALSSSALLKFTLTVPDNEHYFILVGGGQIAFDSAQMSVTGGVTAIFPRGGLPDGVDLTPTVVPMSVVNLTASSNAAYASINIPGAEISAGQILRVLVEVKNADGAAAHNVNTSTYMNLLVRPARLVTEVAVARIAAEGVGFDQLTERLRRPR